MRSEPFEVRAPVIEAALCPVGTDMSTLDLSTLSNIPSLSPPRLVVMFVASPGHHTKDYIAISRKGAKPSEGNCAGYVCCCRSV
jgi:hypothetical protein